YGGQIQRVLIESVNDHDESLLTGRMSNNTLVHFPGNKEMIGEFADVKLLECHGFYYVGELI
ncbi:MAG: TRAM domain-containing protein, partial [Butyrivibrio sp.]|nr:TRAM domain-containing protein [Butyrivibrio sp.]